jgi:hypothetical protein
MTQVKIDIIKLSATVADMSTVNKEMTISILSGGRGTLRSMWPEPNDLDRSMRSLEERIPKAANASSTHMKSFLQTDEQGSRYMVQEKLNGVYVRWDGAQLWTKTGRPVDVPPQFIRFLPPGFAFVGELFFGYGHNEFAFATIVSQNKLPNKKTMEVGASLASNRHVWQHARIVAFDTPMVQHRPYSDRYRLLWQIIASWSRTLYTKEMIDFSLLPVLVIVQFPPVALPTLFQEVVHGTSWKERKHMSFGTPFHQGDKTQHTIAGQKIYLNVAVHGVVYYQTQNTQNREVLFGPDTHKRCSGEGLMLWDQHAIWEGRGGSGRSSPAILKYKPRALTVGVVTSPEPMHTHRSRSQTDEGGEDTGQLPGYTIAIDWWDSLQGRWVSLRPYVSANYGAIRCANRFPQDEKVFFTFVMFDQKPVFLHAIGTHLSQWDALNVKAMLERRSVDTHRTAGERHLTDAPLDHIMRASMWNHGDVCAMFPVNVSWSPAQWLQYSGSRNARRIAANPLLSPDKEWLAKNKNSVLAQSQAASKEHLRRRKERGILLGERLDGLFDTWLREKSRTLTDLFVTFLLVSAAWVTKSNAESEWLATGETSGLVSQWGPFHVEQPQKNASDGEKWIGAQLQMVVTIIGSMWLQFGGLFQFMGNVSTDVLDATNGKTFLDNLHKNVGSFIADVIIPHWEDKHVKECIYPPGSTLVQQNMFTVTGPYTKNVSVETIARYVLFVLHDSWTTLPTNILKVPFGVGDAASVKMCYTLAHREAVLYSYSRCHQCYSSSRYDRWVE